MKKISAIFVLFCAMILMVGCGGSSSQNQGEGSDSERKTGELYGECYPNKTCNEGLVCEIEENVCLRNSNNSENNDDSDSTSEQSNGSNDADTTPESNDDDNESTNNPDTTSDSDDSSSDEIDDTTLDDDTNPISGSDEDTNSSEPEPDEDSGDSTPGNDPEPVNSCDPNPCIGIEHSTETCEAVGGTYRCGCKPNYYWDGYTCGTTETQSAACTGLPYNALWNSVSEIIQTWDNYLGAWVPSSVASYNENSSTNQCKFKCKTGFKWNGSVCLKTGGSSLGQICTGQNSCYDSNAMISCISLENYSLGYLGQDAFYANQGACTPHNFQLETVLNNTTVKDLNTKLEWKQSVSTEKYSWGDAVSYCENLEYAGHHDWRLPSPHEFLTIADRSRYDPAVDTEYFPIPKICSLGFNDQCLEYTYVDLWTSAEYSKDSQEYAFEFRSSTGDISSVEKTYIKDDVVTDIKNYVMCVRGNELPASSFTVKPIGNDVVVVDSANRLMWQKTYESKGASSAVDYCDSLTYSGYSDWRLPNFNELATLKNYDMTEEPYSDFPDMPSGGFISSTKNPKPSTSTGTDFNTTYYYSYLSISFGSGLSFCRCVRDMD